MADQPNFKCPLCEIAEDRPYKLSPHLTLDHDLSVEDALRVIKELEGQATI